MTPFIPGLKLIELFYDEVIRPLLASEFPDLIYSAARIGSGSDVLGYDDALSTDHDWGIRFHLFLTPDDETQVGTAVSDLLANKLPTTFYGHPTHFDEPDDEGTQRLAAIKAGPVNVNHRITITTISHFFQEFLALDPHKELTPFDWLTTPQQLFLGVTNGQVYHDGLNELGTIRKKLAYYPQDIWLYLMAAQWARIGQEEHFLGRAGDVGDELGSQLLAGRLVHDIMQLCFLMARKYAPYPKWFGTAFSRLDYAPALTPILRQVLLAARWQEREINLCQAYQLIAMYHNELGITEPLDTAVTYFHERPYRVINADRFVVALKNGIIDKTVKNIRTNIGSIDQFSHSTDLRSYPELHRRLEVLYT